MNIVRERLATIDADEIDASLPNVVVRVTELFEEFKLKGYKNLTFIKEDVGGSYDHARYDHVLTGEREELPYELIERLEKEKKVAERQAKANAKEREKQKLRNKKKREKEYKKFLELQKKYENSSSQ